jgi:hypothetical protein
VRSAKQSSGYRTYRTTTHAIKRCAAMLVVLLCLWTVPAFAQACAMCYSTAAATSKDGQKAISRAVIVLVAPPLGVMTFGVGLAFRYGRKRDQDKDRDEDSYL